MPNLRTVVRLGALALFLAACSSSGAPAGGGARSDGGARADGGSARADGGALADGGSADALDGGGSEADGGSEVDGGPALPNLDGGTFATCVQTYQCFLGCSTSGSACVDACLAAAQPPGSGAAGVLRDCILTSCANLSGPDLAACIRGQCPNPAAGCQQAECTATSRLIYVVDQNSRLMSFDPTTNTFQQIGGLRCGSLGASTPFSMSVDRTGQAWVLYNDGHLYLVNTANAACSQSGYTSSAAARQFGMGFAAGPNGQRERLYISLSSASSSLGMIDPATLVRTSIGPLPVGEYSPELSGTARAELYAYYPGSTTSFVAQIDPATGSSLRQWSVPTINGQANAWAFAHWGGKFYIFVTEGGPLGASNSKVILLDPATGQSAVILEHLPYNIVGAGVSICAPIK